MDENTQLDNQETEEKTKGEQLKESCESAGITVDFGELSSEAQSAWWEKQANENSTINDFVASFSLTKGESVEVLVPVSGDGAYGDGFRYSLSDSIDVETESHDVLRFTCSGEQGEPVGGFEDYRLGASYYVHFNIYKNDSLIDTRTIDYVFLNEITLSEFNQHLEWWSFSITGNEVVFKSSLYRYFKSRYSDYFEETHNEKAVSYTYSEDFSNDFSTITISYEENEEDGGGGGGSSSTTLNFTAVSGLSGRHNDPLNGNAFSYVPSSVLTVKKYGCGGDGGNGGGGGGGAATVIIRQFTTGKANAVQQIAKSKRHGYGSGGGKGGKGGNGCILIFW